MMYTNIALPFYRFKNWNPDDMLKTYCLSNKMKKKNARLSEQFHNLCCLSKDYKCRLFRTVMCSPH